MLAIGVLTKTVTRYMDPVFMSTLRILIGLMLGLKLLRVLVLNLHLHHQFLLL